MGKDTAASIIVDEINKTPWARAMRWSFAAALRHECSIAYNRCDLMDFEPIDFWSEDPEIKERVIRPVLIAWGMARRHQDPNYWVRQVIDSIEYHDVGDKHTFAVVSDWRFPNEFTQFAKAFPGLFSIHISRPGQAMTPDEIKHDPEVRLNAGFHIENSGSPDDFQRSLHALLYGTILNHSS